MGQFFGSIVAFFTLNSIKYLSRTVVSKSGNTRHIGQVFFDDELSDQVR
jgi:hypothetical protein